MGDLHVKINYLNRIQIEIVGDGSDVKEVLGISIGEIIRGDMCNEKH